MHACFKMTQPMRLTTWEVRIVRDSSKADHQASIREATFHRAKDGDLIKGIISTKGDHPIRIKNVTSGGSLTYSKD